MKTKDNREFTTEEMRQTVESIDHKKKKKHQEKMGLQVKS